MNSRPKASWIWTLLVPGVLVAGCSDATTPARTDDAGADVAPDVESDATQDDAAPPLDAPRDVNPDAKNPPDATPDDVSDDVVIKDGGADADALPPDDAPPPDVLAPDDAPPPDVLPPDDAPVADVPVVDVPVADVPVVDVPVVDVPVADVPAVDVPAVDVPPSSCALVTQRALTLPSDRVMATSSGANRITMSTCAAVGGPEHIYPLHVSARTGLVLSTEGSTFDTVLMLRRACDAQASELACNDDVPGATVSLLRRVVDPGDYFVIVDQYGGMGTGGAYTLAVSSYTPAANAECGGAATLTPGTALTGNTATGGAAGTTCVNDQWGPQLFYTVTVPPGQRATVTATPSGAPAWRAVVRAQANCAATTCLANGASGAAGAAASEVIDNRGTAPLTVVVSVASSSGTTGGAFSLNAALTTLPGAPANATCATPRVVTDGSVITGENPATGTTRLNGACVAGAQGTALFYRATVPSRATLVFTATPAGAWDPVLRLLNACGATSCLASVDAGSAGDPETLRWTNTAAAPQDVYVAASGYDAAAAGPFNGTVRILPPPTNATCARATAVTGGTTLTAQNSAAGIENLTGPCLPTATGTVLYYSVRVGAGEQLTVNAAPVAGVDATVRILDACGASACLASANAGGAGAAESATYTNLTRGERTLVVAVGGATNATNGFFDVSFNVRREYLETTVPRACDDVTGGTRLAGVTGDDTASALADLPFAFSFYGARVPEYSVSSNGLVQLWPSLSGTPSVDYTNVAIPAAAAPNNFIAAFWDDLLPVAASNVTVRTLGTAPDRRFVIQWTSFAFVGDDRAALTFQAKLFETSNAIELHYCTLNAPASAMRATGDSATVGLENATGTAGRQHSFNAAGSVGTTSALRFTP